MRATPHTSWPWPEKAWRTGLGVGRRAEEADRPLGAAERPLVLDLEREPDDGLRLEPERELEDRCLVATWSRFSSGPYSARRDGLYRPTRPAPRTIAGPLQATDRPDPPGTPPTSGAVRLPCGCLDQGVLHP